MLAQDRPDFRQGGVWVRSQERAVGRRHGGGARAARDAVEEDALPFLAEPEDLAGRLVKGVVEVGVRAFLVDKPDADVLSVDPGKDRVLPDAAQGDDGVDRRGAGELGHREVAEDDPGVLRVSHCEGRTRIGGNLDARGRRPAVVVVVTLAGGQDGQTDEVGAGHRRPSVHRPLPVERDGRDAPARP